MATLDTRTRPDSPRRRSAALALLVGLLIGLAATVGRAEDRPEALMQELRQALAESLKAATNAAAAAAPPARTPYDIAKDLEACGPAAVPVLLRGLEEPGVRTMCARALAKVGDVRVVPALAVLQQDPDPGIQKIAKYALNTIGGRTTVEALIASLEHRHVEIRRWAAEALARRADRTAIPALVAALEDRDLAVRRSAAGVLAFFGEKAALPILLEAAQDPDPKVRMWVVGQLGCVRDPRATAALIALTDGASDWRLSEIIRMFSQLRDPAAVSCLLGILNTSASSDLRRKAAFALGCTGDPKVVPVLIAALAEDDVEVRAGAAHGLAEVPDPQVVPALIAAYERSPKGGAVYGAGGVRTKADELERAIRAWSAETLGKTADERVVPTLVSALKDPDADVQFVAAEGLAWFGDSRALPVLVGNLQEFPAAPWVHQVVGEACFALGALGDPAAVEHLLPMLIDPAAEKTRFGNPWWIDAACALAILGRAEAVPTLVDEAMKREMLPAFECLACLACLDVPEAHDGLRRVAAEAKDEKARQFAARAMERGGVGALVAEVKSGGLERGRSLRMLCYWATPAVRPVLVEALASPGTADRINARLALQRLDRMEQGRK